MNPIAHPRKGQKQPVSVPLGDGQIRHPLEQLDKRGAPLWLVRDAPLGARWVQYSGVYNRSRFLGIHGGPLWLPVLAQAIATQPVEHGYGRPRLGKRPESVGRVSHVAWLRDCAGWSTRRIARHLHHRDHHRVSWRDEEAARKQAQRDVAAGRALLAGLGRLPWAAYERGKLPAEWWADRAFALAIDQWHREARWEPAPRDARLPTMEEFEQAERAALADFSTVRMAVIHPGRRDPVWALRTLFGEFLHDGQEPTWRFTPAEPTS